jgi:hypothetical protein
MPFSLTDAELEYVIATLRRRHKDLVCTEDFLLRLIEEKKTKTDVYWSAIGLRSCGTKRCIPALKALADHPSQDVKSVAMLTIAQVAGDAETAYYVECLNNRQYRAKSYALWAIGAVGDSSALDAVHSYVQRSKKALSQPSFDPRAQQEIVAYFYRTLGPQATEELIAGRYALIKEALSNGLNALPPVATENFVKRVPRLKHSLGLRYA